MPSIIVEMVSRRFAKSFAKKKDGAANLAFAEL